MRESTRNLTFIAIFTAILCVISPWAINIGPIPLSFATVAVYLAGTVLGGKRGALSVLVYVLLGAAGLPVFSNFKGGLGAVAGATGGYIVGYILCAFITGIFADRGKKTVFYAAGMVLGTAVLYVFGTAWYCVVADVPPAPAVSACVLPFLPGDGIKIAFVSVFGARLRTMAEKKSGKE